MRRLRAILSDRLYLSLAGVMAVFVVAASYLVTGILDTPLLRQPLSVVVEMPFTGSLYEGSSVTYRGTKIGKITKIQLIDDDSVEATARITSSLKVPASSIVKVRSLSPVGEQYLDFQPTDPRGPYLRDGSRVEAFVTDLPASLAETVINVNKVMRQLDGNDLRTTLQGVSAALNGTGDDIGRIADQGYELLKTLDENWQETQQLVMNGQLLLQLGSDNENKIRQISRDSAKIAAFLKEFNPTFVHLLKVGPGQLDSVRLLIAALDEVLPNFLDRMINVTGIVEARDAHFRELLRSYELGINTLGRAFYDGAARGHLIFQDQYVCDYGAPHHAATDTTTHPVYPDGQCDAPPDKVVRGAKNAPGPTN